jgi:histidinol-phosphate phosphatase family protein
VREGLLKAQENNLELVVATNQSGVARNFLTIKDVDSIHEEITRQLLIYGVTLNQYIFCPHQPIDKCSCRKPNNLMIEEIIRIKKIERKKIFFIGDSFTDVLAAHKSRIQPILIEDIESSISTSLNDVSKVNNFISAIDLVISELL